MARTRAPLKAGIKAQARPTPDTTNQSAAEREQPAGPVIDFATIVYIKELEARVALAEAALTIYKPLVDALRPETPSFTIGGKKTGLANKLKLNPKMLAAMADSHPMLNINTLHGSARTGEELREQTREVYALVTLLLDTMTTEDAKQLKDMLADVLATTKSWKAADITVFEKARNDSRGLPGLYKLVERLCRGAGTGERQVYKYVGVAAVTAVAVLLTKT